VRLQLVPFELSKWLYLRGVALGFFLNLNGKSEIWLATFKDRSDGFNAFLILSFGILAGEIDAGDQSLFNTFGELKFLESQQ
jgi:hypothetical protein